MHASILLDGYQTAERFEEVSREIHEYIKQERDGPLSITFVLNSCGGEASAALRLKQLIAENGCTLAAKIYRAESAAAFLALIAEKREIARNGIFRVDLGGAYIPSHMLLTPEKISTPIVEDARKWRVALFDVLERRGFSRHEKWMTRLLAQNELTLTAEECLALGIVERIV